MASTYLLLTVSTILAFYYSLRKRFKSPPGPKGHFLLGNLSLLQLKGPEKGETYVKWLEEYGSIMHLQVFGNHIFVLNSAQAASDLMDKRAANYSSRPRQPLVCELAGNDWFISNSSGEPHKARRTLAQRYFASHVKDWQGIQLDSFRKLIRNLFADPKDWSALIYLSIASSILRICYDHEVTCADDDFLKKVQEAVEFPRNGPYLVDVFPILKYYPSWLPGGSFRKEATDASVISEEVRRLPFNVVRKEMVAGTAHPSFTSTLLSQLPPDEDLHHSIPAGLIRDSAASMFGAAMDSTVSLSHTFLGMMVLHPDIQRRAQIELDTLLGQDRLPTFDDRPSLPYIDAIVVELLRWSIVAPLGLPHMVSEEDEYLGYRIPKGSTVFGNTWTILWDPVTFPHPDKFDPSRFLPDTEGNVAGRKVVESTVYGWGRRVCPGRHVGNSALFVIITHILTCFDVCKPRDNAGEEYEPVVKFDETPLIRRAIPTPCTLRPRRSDKIASL